MIHPQFKKALDKVNKKAKANLVQKIKDKLNLPCFITSEELADIIITSHTE